MKTNASNHDPHPTADLQTFLEASGIVGTWHWNIIGRTVRYDSGAAALLTGDAALAGADLDRSVAMARVHPADVGWLEHETRRLLDGDGLFLAEYRVLLADGRSRWMLSRGRFDRDDEHHAIRAKGILIDVTDSRETGQGYVANPQPGPSDPLDDVAGYCLVAQRCLQTDGTPLLRMLMNTVLLEVGHDIARRLKRRSGH